MQLSVGAVRSKNAKNIILKILLDACIGAICFYLLGFGFAYGAAVQRASLSYLCCFTSGFVYGVLRASVICIAKRTQIDRSQCSTGLATSRTHQCSAST